jgi:hypothetical protein
MGALDRPSGEILNLLDVSMTGAWQKERLGGTRKGVQQGRKSGLGRTTDEAGTALQHALKL